MAQYGAYASPSYSLHPAQAFAYPSKFAALSPGPASLMYSPYGAPAYGQMMSPTVTSTPISLQGRVSSPHSPFQYGASMTTVSHPVPGAGAMLLTNGHAVRQSPHHSLMQNMSTGEVTNELGGMSSGDLSVLYSQLWMTLDRLRSQVNRMLEVASNTPRSLFISNKFSYTFARNSLCWAGDLSTDSSLNEKATRSMLTSWNLAMDGMRHHLNFEGSALMDNRKFSSELNKLAERMRLFTEELRRYQPCHGILCCILPSKPFNGGKKLERCVAALLATLQGIGNIQAEWDIRQKGRNTVNSDASNRVQEQINRQTSNGESTYKQVILQDGESKAVLRNDIHGRTQFSEAPRPSVGDSTLVLSLPSAPMPMMAASFLPMTTAVMPTAVLSSVMPTAELSSEAQPPPYPDSFTDCVVSSGSPMPGSEMHSTTEGDPDSCQATCTGSAHQ